MAKRKGPTRAIGDAIQPVTPEQPEDEVEAGVAPNISSDEYGEEEEEGGLELSSDSDDDDSDDGEYADGDDEDDRIDGDVENGEDAEEEEDEEEDGFREIGEALGEYMTARESSGRASVEEIGAEEAGRAQGAAELADKSGLAERHAAELADREKGVGASGAEAGRPDGSATGRVPAVEESDSSEDERPNRNTVGNVPLEWYKEEEHIGYDRDGRKLTKKERKDRLDAFLEKSDNDKSWRKVYDEYNDEEVELSKEEIRMIRRIREGRIPHAEVNPYEPYVDWFHHEDKGQPLNSGPEPKRRFIPSKWEAKAVVKLVRAMRKGWIKLDKPPEKPRLYLLWGDDMKAGEKTANGLTYIAAPKPKLPGHEESYNPPIEYVPTEEEVKGYDLMYEEDRPKFIPKQFDSLRKVPAYSELIKEQFDRCLDLYLCPRARKRRINIDPETLIPKLPKPRDLQPFPSTLALEYPGHTGAVTALVTDGGGQWLASASADGSVRVWEVQTGRMWRRWEMGGAVGHLAWNPAGHLAILAVAVDNRVVLLTTGTGTEEDQTAVDLLLGAGKGGGEKDSSLVQWGEHEVAGTGGTLAVTHKYPVSYVTWHHKGDYFASLAPDGLTRSVLVHQLSTRSSQSPFKKNHGRVVRLLFHPLRPFLFVATPSHVRVYNLAKQQLVKKLTAGANHIADLAVHPGGDNLVIGTQDHRVLWFDLDLSTKPYKSMRNHSAGVTGVAFHNSYPLFASTSADGSAQVFHGRVFADLMQNPLIVPLKILRGAKGGGKTGEKA